MPVPRDALVDDFEEDFWLPFTHFHLGDQASVGYSGFLAHSGTRSYHVEIHGWTVRDFGSAYGFAVFATHGASVAELRLALLHDSLADRVPSPWDAFAAGIGLELLDAGYASLGAYRYVTAYRASDNAGRCAPTLSDVVMAEDAPLGVWQEVARDPSADFPGAPWADAAFVKVSVGFLCAAGLTGAAYSVYADDFALETNSGDSDGDGLRDLEEETRVYSLELSDPSVPRLLPSGGEVLVDLVGPPVSGAFAAGAVAVDLVHPRVDDLSVSLVTFDEVGPVEHLLWDPGVRARGVAILEPIAGQSVHGIVSVEGRVEPEASGHWCHLLVEGVDRGTAAVDGAASCRFAWSTDVEPEGARTLQIVVSDTPASLDGGSPSEAIFVSVDRTPPELEILSPSAGGQVSGLLRVEAGVYDAVGVASVELFVDGARADLRESEPYVFPYETLDLTNAAHTLEVRAVDRAGNLATHTLSVTVANKANAPPPPCYPACNLTTGTSTGNLAPVRVEPASYRLRLASSAWLDVTEGLRVPWRPQVLRTADGVSLVLGVSGETPVNPADGLVAPTLSSSDFLESGTWRLIVRDHGAGLAGFVQKAAVRFAVRTLPGAADTDGDSLSDGAERGLGLLPVAADLDGDGLSDGYEMDAHAYTFMVDGVPYERSVRTDPLDPDGDRDGLSDGEELFPPPGLNRTDPTVADTDADALEDGPERHEYGTDATRSDTDGDGLRDGREVEERVLDLTVDGSFQRRWVATSPLLADTDADGLGDAEEWDGAARYGFPTDPSDPDTDRDGLSDGEEVSGVHRRPTNPLRSDTDADGLGDALDESPLETWGFDWRSTFEPGLARFTQRVHALDVHGTKAEIWTYNVLEDSCVYLSDHTAEATRSSDESIGNVGAWINKTFLEGGESNYTVAGLRYLDRVGWSWYQYVRGACDALAPRQYVIEYETHDHLYEVDFVNVAPVNLTDIRGGRVWHTSFDVPMTPSVPETIVLQVVVDAAADRGGLVPGGEVVPLFQYTLYRSGDFLDAPPFYQNVAVGAPIDEHAYQFSLRIPKGTAKDNDLVFRAGKAYARLVLTPFWVNTAGYIPEKTAMLPSSMHVGSVVTRLETTAAHIIARLSLDLRSVDAELPDSIQYFPTGTHVFGPYRVYVYHLGDAYDSVAASLADVVWLDGTSEEEIAGFQAGISWSPQEAWLRGGVDAFGMTAGILKILRRGLSITGQLTSGLVPSSAPVPSWTWAELTVERSYTVVTRMEGVVTQEPLFLVSNSGTSVVNLRTYDLQIDCSITETTTVEWEMGNVEILDDLDDSASLPGTRFVALKSGLQGAAIGATLVIFGGQAVLAYAQGDSIKGTVYSAATGVSVYGIVRGDIKLASRLAPGRSFLAGVAVRVGAAATLAVGGILASYELYLAGASGDSISQLMHYEAASTSIVDTLIAVVPLYGVALALAWQLGLGLVVAVQSIAGIVPDALAARIVSSPGSTVVFLFEYTLGTAIPSSIAEDALITLLSRLNENAILQNNMNPPTLTILVAP